MLAAEVTRNLRKLVEVLEECNFFLNFSISGLVISGFRLREFYRYAVYAAQNLLLINCGIITLF
jgi:hypothetical protein